MTDRYLAAVNSGVTKTVAKRLGLPRPVVLRRYVSGDPLTPGPVLVLDAASNDGALQPLTEALLSWGLDVRRTAGDDGDRWGAIIVIATELSAPEDLSETAMALGSSLRSLAPGGRVVTISRAPGPDDTPLLSATRSGIEGFVRSLAKELRYGATANGIQLTDGATEFSGSALATLRFLLSGRSAYVDGQLIHVGLPVATPTPKPKAKSATKAASSKAASSKATQVAKATLDAVLSTGKVEPAAGGSDRVPDDAPLTGRVAVVTGAARGIGATVARTLHRDGATIIAVDVPASGEALAAIANEVGGTALQLDITAEDAGARLLDHARTRHGGLHILIHNAGILRDKLLANMSAGQWDSVIAVNLAAQLRITQSILAADGFSDAPRIVSLASTSGIAGNRGQTNYGYSKAGVIGATRATASLMATLGGTANAVAPGFIETDMTASMPVVTREMGRRGTSLQQGGQPIDVAETIAFLASPDAAGINGQIVRVCGQSLVGQ